MCGMKNKAKEDSVRKAIFQANKIWGEICQETTPYIEPSEGWWPICADMAAVSIQEIDGLRSNISRVWNSDGGELRAVWEGMSLLAKKNLLRSVCPHMPEDVAAAQSGSRPQLYKLFLGSLNQQDLISGSQDVEGVLSFVKGWMTGLGCTIATLVALLMWVSYGVLSAFSAWITVWAGLPLLGFFIGWGAIRHNTPRSLSSLLNYLCNDYNEIHDIEFVRQVTREILAKHFKDETNESIPNHKKTWFWVKNDQRGQRVTEKEAGAPSFNFQRLDRTYEICEQTEWEFHLWRCFNMWKTCAVLLDELRTKALQKGDGYITSASACLLCRKVFLAEVEVVFCPSCKSAPYCSRKCCDEDWKQHIINCLSSDS